MTWIKDAYLSSKVLIVDDEALNVELLQDMLEVAGLRNVTGVTDPREVLALQQKEGFDLIILDINMPHLNGYQVMEQLSSSLKDDYLPVLVITAQNDLDTRNRSLTGGARDFVTKPFQLDELLNRISNMLEVRDLYKQKMHYAELLEKKVLVRTEQLNQRNKELDETRYQIIRCLGRASEYRDNETGNHVSRMSKSCELIALHIGLHKDQATLILNASPLHDIGKIGIPDNILLKPGKLQELEWTVMKTHVEIGVEILSGNDSQLMQLSRSIAQHHHEKWDGSGYPKGIKASEIPIEGRIAAICDVFDALTSVRPYKNAWSDDDAITYVNENAGRHFDPELVMAFNELQPKLKCIRDKYSDS